MCFQTWSKFRNYTLNVGHLQNPSSYKLRQKSTREFHKGDSGTLENGF